MIPGLQGKASILGEEGSVKNGENGRKDEEKDQKGKDKSFQTFQALCPSYGSSCPGASLLLSAIACKKDKESHDTEGEQGQG